MSQTLEAASSDATNLDLVIDRVLDVPVARIWKCWADPKLMEQWFCPRPWYVKDVQVDLRPGGAFSFTIHGPNGEKFPNSGSVIEAIKHKKIVTTDTLGPGFRPTEKPFFSAILTLEDLGGKTRYHVVARHKDEATRQQHEQMGFDKGWNICIDQLEALARTLPDEEPQGPEAEVFATIDRWTRALERKDVDTMMADYVDDAVLFDCIPPHRTIGREAIKKIWEQCLPHFPATFRCESHERRVHVSGDIAFMHQLHRIVTDEVMHPAALTWLRITVCYRKIDGRWMSVHDHVSLPFDPYTSKVAFITDVTKPDGGITSEGPSCTK